MITGIHDHGLVQLDTWTIINLGLREEGSLLFDKSSMKNYVRYFIW